MGKVDVEFPKEHPLEVNIHGVAMGTVSVSSYSSSIVKMSRQARHFNSDEINIIFCESGSGAFVVNGKEVVTQRGDIIIRDSTVDGAALAFEPAHWKTVIAPRARLAPLLNANKIEVLGKRSFTNSAARLLHYYINAVMRDGGAGMTSFEQLTSNHILDLTALLLGPQRDIAQHVENTSASSVRYHAAVTYIRAHLSDPNLSDDLVAKHLGVSSSYIRKLFTGEGGLHAFIVRERLDMAHGLLTAGRVGSTKIIDIAFRCGFASLYTFNRQFKRRYGYTPSAL